MLAGHCLRSYSQEVQQEVIMELMQKTPGKNINIGKGFGITHTRTEKVDNIEVAVGLFRDEVKIIGKESLHTLFCIIIPPSQSRIYLSFIAHLSRLLSSPRAREIFKSASPENVLQFIQKAES